MRKVKKLDKWVSHKLAANLKNLQFEVSSSLILCNNSEPFLNQMVMCEEKWILWQLVMTSSVDGPRRSSKALPTANLASKRGTGHCLVVCCQSDVLWLSESLQNHYSWDVCWTNRWDALKTAMSAANIGQQKRAQFFSMTTSDDIWLQIAQPMLQKLNELGRGVLPHPLYSPDLSPTDHHFFKHLDSFLQGERFHNQQEAEDAFQEFVEFWSTDFYATGINKLISHWQKCVDCNGFYFD